MGSNTTTESQTSELPQWQEDYIRKQIMPKATEISTAPYQAYTGQTVAALNPLETQAQNTLAGSNFGAPQYQQAQNVFSQLSSMRPEDFTAMNRQNYNPFQQDVVNATDAQQRALRAQQQLEESQNITNARAFGNDRRGTYEGARQGAFETGYAGVMANLMSQGYNQAQAATMAQLAQRGQTAGSLVDTTGAANQAMLQGAQAQLGAGQVGRSIEQAQLQSDQEAFAQQQAYPLQQLNALLAGAGGIPSGLGTVTGTKDTGMGGTLSALGSLGQAGASFGMFGPSAQGYALGAAYK